MIVQTIMLKFNVYEQNSVKGNDVSKILLYLCQINLNFTFFCFILLNLVKFFKLQSVADILFTALYCF